ncbi:hypothetical protein QKW35_09995 [Pontibacterium granulatum]|uniref:hypothetical protein n=1 Tax=Pontibacterium granulatum TaxID=2036029 RepID=UPI00249A7088|nr:hypothetical protein [Pontibacterium granulatum]MDI3324707.1 hypothetical protein [Pontibacterium granulatum]
MTVQAYPLPPDPPSVEPFGELLLATHYLDRKEVYFLGREEMREMDEDDHDNAMPKQPNIYDPELYRGR